MADMNIVRQFPRSWQSAFSMLMAVGFTVSAASAWADGEHMRHRHRFADPAGYAHMMPPPGDSRGDVRPMRPPEFPLLGQMSPDERRQLRRDIRNARDDIYRRPPPPPGQPVPPGFPGPFSPAGYP